jgi:hypothetical protein
MHRGVIVTNVLTPNAESAEGEMAETDVVVAAAIVTIRPMAMTESK